MVGSRLRISAEILVRVVLRVLVQAQDLLCLVVAQATLVHITRDGNDFLLCKVLKVMRVLGLSFGLVRNRRRTEHLFGQRASQIHLGLDFGGLLGAILLALSDDAQLGLAIERGGPLALQLLSLLQQGLRV